MHCQKVCGIVLRSCTNFQRLAVALAFNGTCVQITAQPTEGKKDNTATAEDGAVITDAGQLRRGTIVPNLMLGL